MTTARVPIQRALKGRYVTDRAVAAFAEMLRLAELCAECDPPMVPGWCRCSPARITRWLELDGIIYAESLDRRPWEHGRMVLPPNFPGDDRWTRRSIERWTTLEAAVKARDAAEQ